MTIYLRQSTASQEVPLGYFLDSTDGNTEKTGLTIANTDIKIWKTNTTTVTSKNSGGATHISNGIYYCVLDATDTDTLGPIVLFTHVAGALVVRVEGVVLAANIYDSMIAGTDLFDVSVTQWTGTNVASPDTAGYPKVTLKSGTGTGELNISGGNLAGSVASVVGAVGSVTGAVGSVTGNVGGNVTGSVGSVTGNVGGNVVGSVASVTGNVGGNVVGSVASVTGNVGGNVVGSVASVTAAVTLSAKDTLAVRNNTAQAGAAGTITLDASASATDNLYNGSLIKIDSGTGAGQTRIILSYVGSTKVATVDRNWVTNPDNTSVFTIISEETAKLTSSLEVTVGGYASGQAPLQPTVAGRTLDVTTTGEAGIDWANIGAPTTTVNLSGTTISTSQVVASVSGAVGSVTGAVGSVTGAVGSVTGDVGGNVVGSVGSVTGNVGGNVTGSVGSVTGNVGGNVVGSVASVTAAVTLLAKDSYVLRSNTATAGAAGTITLDGSASTVDNFYNGALIKIDSGTGIGQARVIVSYVGSTKVATVDRNWVTNPANGSGYTVCADGLAKLNTSLEVTSATVTGNVSVGSIAANAINSTAVAASAASKIGAAGWEELTASHTTFGTYGQYLKPSTSATAQAGAAGTITLDALSSATNDFYINQMITIASGTGAGQSRLITAYNGTTKVATISPNWVTNPDNTSVFIIAPFAITTVPSASTVAAAVWDLSRSGHSTSGTFGEGVASVQGNVTGSVASVSGNVGGNVSGNVTGSVGSIATGGITASSIASSAITAAKFATDAIDNNALASSAVTEIQSGLATASAVSAIQSDTDDIQSRLPAALVGGRMSSDIGSITSSTAAANVLQKELSVGVYGTAVSGSNSYIDLAAGSANATSGFYTGMSAAIVSGTGAGQVRMVYDYDQIGNRVYTTPNWAIDPDSTSGYVIFAAAGVDVQTVQLSQSAASYLSTNISNLDATITSRLAPTTSGRTLDVTATGEAGIDWANIGSPTTSVNLSGTTISTSQVVASVTGAVGSVTGAVASVTGNVGGNVTGSVGSVVGAVGSVTGNVGGNVTGSIGSVASGGITSSSFASGAIDAAAIATDAITSAELATSAVTEIAGAVWDITLASHLTGGTTGAALNAAGSAGDPWGTALPGAYSAGSAGYILGTNLDTLVSSRLAPTVGGRTLDVSSGGEAGIDWANVGSPTTSLNLSGTTISTSQTIASVSGAVGSVTGAVASVTGNVGGNVVGSVGSIATGGITSSSFAASAINAAAIASSAITAAKFATDAIDNNALAANAVTEIQTGLATSSALSTAQTSLTDIQTRLPATLVGGRIDASVGAYQSGLTPLQPTTAGRTLDVTATGEAGIDWGNIGSPTTSVNLSGTTISTTQTVASVSGSVGSVTGAVGSVTGNVGGNVTGSVGSVVGAVGSVTGNVGGNVVGSVGSVTAAVTLNSYDTRAIRSNTAQAGASGSITLDASASAVTDFYVGTLVEIEGGTGAGQARTITAYNGTSKVASVDRNWATTPDNTSVFTIVAADNAKLNTSLETVAASVTGSVGSVVGAVGSVTGSVGSVVGSVGSVTGNVGGNVTGSVGSIATGGITSSSFASGAIDAAAIATDAITSAELASSAVTEIAGAVWEEARASHNTAGSFGQGIASVQGNVTGSVGSVTGNVGGNVVGSVASVTAGVTVTTNNDKTGYGLSAGAVQAVWDALTSALTTSGSIGKLLTDNVNATISSRLASGSYTAPDNATIGTINTKIGTPVVTISDDIAAVKSVVDSVQTDTNDIQTRLPAALISGRIDASVGAYQSGLTPLQPTTSGRTLDVTATGAAGIDWGNVENPTTTLNLSGTTISTSQTIASVSGAVGSVTGAVGSVTGSVGSVVGAVGSVTGNVGGNVTGSVGSVVGNVGGNLVGDVLGNVANVLALANNSITSGAIATSGATEIAGAVWEELASSHVTSGSFGQILQSTLRTGTAQAGSTNTITLDAGASSSNSFYNDQIVRISSGTGANQARVISAYNGTSKVATVSSNWVVTPDNTSVFVIQAFGVSTASTPSAIATAVWEEATSAHTTAGTFGQSQQPVRSGTAQGGGSNTITLDSGASSSNSYYNDQLILITGGTGAGQARGISNYVGGTKVATVTSNWTTNPDNTSIFVIYPFAFGAASSPSVIASAVWEELRTNHTNVGTFGEGINVVSLVADSITSTVLAASAVTEIQSGLATASAVSSIQSDTDDIQSRLPAALVSGRMASDAIAISGSTSAADSVEANIGNLDATISSRAAAATALSTAQWTNTRASNLDNLDVAVSSRLATVGYTAPASTGSIADAVWDELLSGHAISGSAGDYLVLTDAILDDTGNVIPAQIAALPSNASIADAVWDEDITTHNTTDSAGEALLNAQAGTAPTAADVADAVWDEARAGHVTAGSFGQGVSSVQGNVTGSVASVAGAVGSVTGAVGSVTGNIGGNVTGSVGSIASGGITASSFATDSITNTALASSAVTEIQSGLATASSIAALPTAASNADAVWDEILSGHAVSGSTGEALSAAGASGDPWITALPGSYSAGQAGYIVGTNLDALVSSRLASGSYTAPDNATIGTINTKLGTPVSSVSADIAGVQSDTNDIQTRLPAALVSGRMASDAVAISGSTATADNVESNIGNLNASVSSVAGLVWDQARSAHTSPGSYGEGISSVQGNVTGDLGGDVGGDVVGFIGSLSPTAKSDVRGQIDASILNYRLDQLLSDQLNSDPASGSVFGDLLQDAGGGVYQFNAQALENAPAGGGGGTSDWTSTEKAQIRFRLGLDGSVNTPSATPDLANGGDIDDVLAAVAGTQTTVNTINTTVNTINTTVNTVNTKIGTPISSVSADIAGVQSDTNDIQTRLPAALVSGRMASDAVAISGSTSAADNVETNITNLDATISTRAPAATALSTVQWTNGRASAIDNLNATITSRLSASAYVAPTTPPTVNAIADAVWDEDLSGHLASGSTGNKLNAAASAGDPWVTDLPGSYGVGEAGYILGNLSGGGGGGSGDWSSTELQQIRYRLGIDGVASIPTAQSHITVQTGGSVTTGGAPIPSTSTELNVYAGSDFAAVIAGADISGPYTSLVFSAKLATTQSLYARDSLIQIDDGDGLKYLNSAAVDIDSADLASLTVVDNTMHINIEEAITIELQEAYGVKWTIKKTTTSGINIIASGVMNIRRVVLE